MREAHGTCTAPVEFDRRTALPPRLTPSVAAALHAASIAATGAHARDCCGVLMADAADPDTADLVEFVPCAQGAGYPLSAEEAALVAAKARQLSTVPKRSIAAFVRTCSNEAPGFSLQDNAALLEIAPDCPWLLVTRALPRGASRVRAFRHTDGAWFQSADFELYGGASPPATGRAIASFLGRIPPAAGASVAALAVLFAIWLCLRPRAPDPALRVGVSGAMLGLTWDGTGGSSGGVLTIDDGAQHRVVPLSPGQVSNGLVLYRPLSNQVRFQLEIRRNGAAPLRSSLRWAASVPP